MSDALKTLLQPPDLKDTLFASNSRYHGVEITSLETCDKKTVVYLRRRFCPPPEGLTVLQEHTVTQGERLDNIAAKYLGDPEQAWRICDANRAMSPGELTDRPGQKLNIALSEGTEGS